MNGESDETTRRQAVDDSDEKGAGVKFPPPLIFLLCLLAGIGLNWLWPVSLRIPSPLNFLGSIFVITAFVILILPALDFRRVKTAIEPWKPTTTLIYSGCYKFSRNPIYLGFCLCLAGLGIMANSLWIVLSFLPCGLLVYYIAIVKEEAYLAEKFGDDYLNYKQRVRRWL